MIRRSEICSSMYSPHDHERCGTCFLKRLASTLKGGLLPLNPTMMMSPTKELPSRLVADTTPKQSESWSRPLNIHQISPQPRSSDFQRSLDSSQSKSLYGFKTAVTGKGRRISTWSLRNQPNRIFRLPDTSHLLPHRPVATLPFPKKSANHTACWVVLPPIAPTPTLTRPRQA